jgi:hypothetical protein
MASKPTTLLEFAEFFQIDGGNFMKNQILKFITINLFAIFFATTISINAQNRDNSNRVSNSTIQALITRIQAKTDVFKRSVTRGLNRNAQNNTTSQDTIFGYITDFENETTQLKQSSTTLRAARTDVQDLLSRAVSIDDFVRDNRLNAAAQRDWSSLRADLDTLAGYYNVSSNWNQTTTNTDSIGNTPSGTTGSYRVPENNVRTLLARLQTRTDAYKRELNATLDRGVLNQTRSQTTIYGYVTDLQNATERLRQNFDSRRSTSADIDEVLNRAYYIDSFMRDYRLSTGAESQWRLIRTDLDTLANYYNVTWNWNRQYSPASQFDQMLTGTYRLNASQSDDVRAIVDRAAASLYATNQRDNLRRNLERRLSSPDTLVIEKRGSQVTIASNTSPQVSFNADGTARNETTANGRNIRVTANTTYDGVALSTEGDRGNDFYVNFIPMSNGQLRVIRRVYLENRNDTVTVASVYDKTDNVAQFSNIGNQNSGNNQNGGYNQNGGAASTDFVIPNNTRLTAALRTAISTKNSQNGERFSMEVTSPSEFNGATIEGRVATTQRSGVVTGRANMSLEFDTIRLRDGRTYRFAGIVDDVTLANGERVTVNNEGTVRDNNQTTKTVTRAGIGAALGALIGAIAGGGSGAAVGAAVGAGAGAGTVVLQGRGDVDLTQGTQFTITASAPANANLNR